MPPARRMIVSLFNKHISFSCHPLSSSLFLSCHTHPTCKLQQRFYCTSSSNNIIENYNNTMASNPIGELLELCAIIRVPYVKSFEKNGTLFKCIVSFMDKKVESEWFSSQKEAEQHAALTILTTMPVRKILQRGNAHEMSFRAEVSTQGVDGASPLYYFSSEWSKKKVEAKRELLQKVANYYFGSGQTTTTKSANIPSPVETTTPLNDVVSSSSIPAPNGQLTTTPKSSAEFYAAPARDATTNKLRNYIVQWQVKNLADKIIGPLPEPHPAGLDGLITVAFIHSSFTNTTEIEQIMEDIGLPYPNYERLEFYGDSVLGFLASKMLLLASKKDTPHELTIKKQQLVREDACCNYMKKLGLDTYIIHRDILQTLSAKVICDVFEAIIGALYSAYEEKSHPVILRLLQPNSY